MRLLHSPRPQAMLLAALLAVLPLLAAQHACAAPLPPSPDLLEPLDVVSTGRWQSDVVVPTARSLRERLADDVFGAPTLLRVGVGRSIELRTAVDAAPPRSAFETSTDAMRRLHGFTDVSFGAKWRVRGGDAGWLPGVAWLANVETTTGSPAFRDRDFRPSLRATAEWELPHDMTLGLMPGIFRDRDDNGKHYAAGVLALTLGKAWTPRLHSFVELAGERVAQQGYRGAQVNVDTGLAFHATQSLQVAAVVSRGFMNTTQDVRGGLSISARF
jgi:hypothetical protein